MKFIQKNITQLKTKHSRLINHLLFWLLFLLFQLTRSTTAKSLVGDYWWGDWSVIHVLLDQILFNAIFAYGLLYFIVPRYLDTKKYFLFGAIAFMWLYFTTGLYVASFYYYLEHIYTLYMWHSKEEMATMYLRLTNIGFLLTTFSNFLYPTIILGAIKFYKKKTTLSKIEEEKNKMELLLLKNQLNPHFLFNTLNNIYSFVIINSPKAPDMIMQLSGILDYVLYKSQKKTVPLSEELTTIEHFIGLEKIRYEDRLKVDFKTSGNTSASISPLLLLSLVENAFKHGVSSDYNTSKIKINIKESNGLITCEVWNTKPKHKTKPRDINKTGIGLSNIKRQLKLIYRDNHTIKIDDNNESFNVFISINTHS